MIYIIVPCYNEEEMLPETTRQLLALLPRLGSPARILYVDDGSRDRTWPLITELSGRHEEVLGLKLAHNVGHQNALWAGMEAAAEHADALVSVDADLQDDIRVIEQMARDWREGADVVYGVRRERKTDTWFKRTTALAFYRLMTTLGSPTIYNHADFRLLSRRAARALLSYPERNLFLRGLVPMLGFNEKVVYYDRRERMAGTSKYPLRKMISFALDGITSFSVKPLRLVSYMGGLFILVAIGVLVYTLLAYVQHRNMPGWASLLISIWFVGGALLVSIGVMGEYIGKIYTEVKRRPRYFEQERAGKSW